MKQFQRPAKSSLLSFCPGGYLVVVLVLVSFMTLPIFAAVIAFVVVVAAVFFFLGSSGSIERVHFTNFGSLLIDFFFSSASFFLLFPAALVLGVLRISASSDEEMELLEVVEGCWCNDGVCHRMCNMFTEKKRKKNHVEDRVFIFFNKL
jgi:predicted ABC-type exoprotein transport system permease subunit